VSVLQILAAAVLMSTGGAAIKLASLSSIEIAALRSLFAAFVLMLATRAWRGSWSPRAWAVGMTVSAMMILFVAANRMTTAANTIYLQSTAPLYVLLVAPRLLGEPVTRRDLAYMTALACGLLMFFVGTEPPVATAPRPVLGNVLAVTCGATWAATIVGLRWLAAGRANGMKGPNGASGGSAGPALVIANLATFAVGLPWLRSPFVISSADWMTVAYLGLFQVGAAYVLFNAGVRKVPALETSLLLLLEPVLNPVWAWVVHGEMPRTWALAGGAVIVGSTAVKTLVGSRRD